MPHLSGLLCSSDQCTTHTSTILDASSLRTTVQFRSVYYTHFKHTSCFIFQIHGHIGLKRACSLHFATITFLFSRHSHHLSLYCERRSACVFAILCDGTDHANSPKKTGSIAPISYGTEEAACLWVSEIVSVVSYKQIRSLFWTGRGKDPLLQHRPGPFLRRATVQSAQICLSHTMHYFQSLHRGERGPSSAHRCEWKNDVARHMTRPAHKCLARSVWRFHSLRTGQRLLLLCTTTLLKRSCCIWQINVVRIYCHSSIHRAQDNACCSSVPRQWQKDHAACDK